MRKSIVLTFLSGLLLAWFCLLPYNHQWFDQRILGYWNDFLVQKDKPSLEQRKVKRWQSDYTVSKQIANFFFSNNNHQNVLVLIPPSVYFKERKIDYHVPEPAVFYYYTGLKTTWINSVEAAKATWMVSADNGVLKFIPVKDKKMLLDSIAFFKKYPVGL